MKKEAMTIKNTRKLIKDKVTKEWKSQGRDR